MTMKKLPAIGVELSNVCNLVNVCRHCYGVTGISEKGKIITISNKTLEMLIDEIPLIANSVTITGGEPTMYPRKVNDFVRRIGLPWMLMTNGVVYCKDFHPQAVLVSLDAQDIRPEIDPRKVIKNVLRYGCNLSVNTVISKETNLFSFYELLKKASVALERKNCHISEWKINFVVQRGFAVNHFETLFEWDTTFKHLAEFLKVYFQEQPFHLAVKGLFFTKNLNNGDFIPGLNSKSNPCLDCLNRGLYMTINAYEEIQLCSVARNKAVSIKKGLIDACFKVFQFPELKQMTYRNWKNCQKCKWIKICGCGCPSLAETYGGKWTGKDVFQCKIMEQMEKYLLPVLPSTIQRIFSLKL
jgi:radical SAM protein with 4Fe4S-binding SPASM domain